MRRPAAGLALPLLLCLGLSLFCLRAAPLLYHADATHYLSLAEGLAQGRGYRSNQLVFPDLMQPPLYPALVAAGTLLFGSSVAAAIVVCLLCQLLTVAALYACHGLLWGPRDRWVSALLGAVSPNLAFGATLLLEPLFVCTLAWALHASLRALHARSAGLALLAGLCLGLALLSRPEVVVTGAVLVALCLLWPAPFRRRLLLACALLAGGLVCALPYGLWMKARLGFFEVLPKVRYNVPFADINAHMAWEPDEERLGTREQRTFFTLMPDRRDFVMNYAFAHPEFDPRSQFPRRPVSRRDEIREVLWSSRAAMKDALLGTGALHPLALLLLALGLRRALRADEPQGLPRRERRLTGLALLGLVGLNLGPAMVSGVDYYARYLAASALLALPLSAGGAAPLARALGRLVPARAALPLVAGLAALLHAAGTVHAARSAVSRPALRARMAAMERLCAERLPRGARVLAEHPRYAFLQGGATLQLPYSRSLEELLDYVRIHRVEWALLDSASLLRNPSRVNRTLADPRRWPPGWTAAATLFAEGQPVWLVRLPGQAAPAARP